MDTFTNSVTREMSPTCRRRRLSSVNFHLETCGRVCEKLWGTLAPGVHHGRHAGRHEAAAAVTTDGTATAAALFVPINSLRAGFWVVDLEEASLHRSVGVDRVVDVVDHGALEWHRKVLGCLGVRGCSVVVEVGLGTVPDHRRGLFASAGVHAGLVDLKAGGRCASHGGQRHGRDGTTRPFLQNSCHLDVVQVSQGIIDR